MMLRIYDDWKEARQRLLRRRKMGVGEQVPESMRAAIRRLFGEELTPEAAVARILADVRQCRDEALRAWTARTDGVTIDDFEVPAEAPAAAQASLPPDLAEALELAADRLGLAMCFTGVHHFRHRVSANAFRV